MKLILKHCKFCGKGFETRIPHKRFCSEDHAVKSYRSAYKKGTGFAFENISENNSMYLDIRRKQIKNDKEFTKVKNQYLKAICQ